MLSPYNGHGYAVQAVIDAARSVTGRDSEIVHGASRPGDPARLVADATLAKTDLGWRSRYTGLETIIAHAWQW